MTPPFSFGVGVASGTSQGTSGRVHFDERKYLLDGQGKEFKMAIENYRPILK